MSTHRLSGSILVFLGAVFWSLNAPLVKFLSADPMLICGLRSLIAGLVLAPFIRPKRLNWTPWMFLYIASYCALCISIITALSKTAAAIAIGMQYTATFWLFAATWISTGRFNRKAFLPICLILIGVAFFMYTGNTTNSSVGNLIALTEGIFFACMSVGAKKSAGTNPLGLTAIANLCTGVFVLACFPASTASVFSLSGQSLFVILVLGIVQIGAGYSFYNLGIQKVTAQKASIIALWEMILGPVWVALFLKEYPSVTVLIGFCIILAGIYIEAKTSSPATGKAL